VNKHDRLIALAKRRQSTRWGGYGCIADYYDGAYECEAVSPYTRTAGNVDAMIFLLLQDWCSHDFLSLPFNRELAQHGQLPRLPTNMALRRLLRDTFDVGLEDVYGTNLFPFIKPGAMDTKIPARDLQRAANEFAVPQIEIVEPALVLCLGAATFNALRATCGWPRCSSLSEAVSSPFSMATTRIWCQAHPGAWGRRIRGGIDGLLDDWRTMRDAPGQSTLPQGGS
jgi:uracil-DNA glycosylase